MAQKFYIILREQQLLKTCTMGVEVYSDEWCNTVRVQRNIGSITIESVLGRTY